MLDPLGPLKSIVMSQDLTCVTRKTSEGVCCSQGCTQVHKNQATVYRKYTFVIICNYDELEFNTKFQTFPPYIILYDDSSGVVFLAT